MELQKEFEQSVVVSASRDHRMCGEGAMTEVCGSTCVSWGPWVLALTLFVFDFGTAVLLRWALYGADVAAMIREKGPVGPRAPARTVSGESGRSGETASGDISYSRVAGVVGSVVMACFFWAFGNILIFRAFVDPGGATVRALVEGVWPWLTAGAAMFLPYAVNQLRSAFH
jgi:hypothetical protein